MRNSTKQPDNSRHPEPAGDSSLPAGRGVFLFPRPATRETLRCVFETREPPECFRPSRNNQQVTDEVRQKVEREPLTQSPCSQQQDREPLSSGDRG